ncbi:MAG TPA: PAS domain-containing protein [Terrimicrobiaceae bacterium]|nr:PAS domain-containing protein [Terrimicrobiaceae bacterium]
MNAPQRARALADYEILDSPPEASFDDFTRMASQICGTPVSLISLLDAGRQWFKSTHGVEISETPIELSFCAHAVAAGELLEVPDARNDVRFRENPLVTGFPHVRFYAGAPLVTPEGVGIGSLCVIDTEPRRLTPEQRNALASLGRQLMHLFELRRVARKLRSSEAAVSAMNRRLENLVGTKTSELRDSEERFRQLAENSSEVFWFVSMNPERILYVSPAVEAVWGRPAEEFYRDARAWLKAVHPDDQPRLFSQLAGVTQSKSTRFVTEYRVVRPDGSVRWVLYRGTPLRDASGQLARVGGIASDITEQKNAEEAVRISAERMRLAAQSSQTGIWEWEPQSGELTWNEEMFSLYGLDKDAPTPGLDRWSERLHPDDREMAYRLLDESLKDNAKPFDLEFRIIRANDGAVRHLRAMARCFQSWDGKQTRMIGTNRDVTDEREREQSLAAALSQQKALTLAAQAGERAKNEFLAVMSHEIRTPLNSILGFSEILAGNPELSEDSRTHVETIAASGGALLRILNNILDFSRIEAGQLELEKTTFSPAEMIADIHVLFSSQARQNGIDFTVHVDPSVPARTMGDPGRVGQILLNLTGNALKFTDAGSIILGVRPGPSADSEIEFWVEDTGPGIPPGKLESIFDAFTQADSSHARRYGGTGIGLAISRKLAGLMHGSLRAENRPGGGARFFLRVPAPQVEAGPFPEPGLPAPVPSPAGQGTILVAEDDPVNLRLILSLIRKLGHEPLTARNGREAVEIYESHRPSCILMDVQMPEMDGIAATIRIREIESREGSMPVYISALTANVLPEDRRRCLEAGMNFHLGKPIQRDAISAVLGAAAAFGRGRAA